MGRTPFALRGGRLTGAADSSACLDFVHTDWAAVSGSVAPGLCDPITVDPSGKTSGHVSLDFFAIHLPVTLPVTTGLGGAQRGGAR